MMLKNNIELRAFLWKISDKTPQNLRRILAVAQGKTNTSGIAGIVSLAQVGQNNSESRKLGIAFQQVVPPL